MLVLDCTLSLSPPEVGAVAVPTPVLGGASGSQSSLLTPNNDGKKSKTRTSITPQQLEVLMAVYNREQRPAKAVREDLVAKTGLEMKVIQVWFQNRRSKEKRDGTMPTTATPVIAAKEELGTMATPVVSSAAPPVDEEALPVESFTPQCEGKYMLYAITLILTCTDLYIERRE